MSMARWIITGAIAGWIASVGLTAAPYVPLVVRGPGIPAGRSSRPVQSVDVFPTVLELLDVPYAGPMHGHSLLGNESADVVAEWYAWPGKGINDPRGFERFNRDLRTLKHGPYKLFADDRGRFKLFNLEEDPGELHDLAKDNPRILGDLRARLDAWLARHPAAKTGLAMPQDVTEQVKQLRALGYVD